MDSPRPPQLPKMRTKPITMREPPTLGQDPRRFAISIFLQACLLGMVLYQMKESGTLAAIANYVGVVNPWSQPCGLLSSKEFILVSDNIVLPSGTFPGYGTYFRQACVFLCRSGVCIKRSTHPCLQSMFAGRPSSP